ncbi:MAG TPA: dihydrolipoamide acetyltransferase family protein [Actinomycetota bacterium]|nr:dihydrolipoamide acetyltransferase family protein [Actinomycetota bacterium]
MPDFKLPDLGEGVTEAEIDKWLVKEGDTLNEDDPLVEVITDKASAEIPSPYAGLVTKIHVQAGDVVPVGTVLVSIGESSDSERPAGGDRPSLSSDSPRDAAGSPAASLRNSPEGGSPSSAGAESVKAMPPVRKLARELGVDISAITPSGPDGRVTREDVEAFAGDGDGEAFVASVGSEGERREPYRGVRRLIGERMSQAHRVVPPVTHVEECDVTELEATRKMANERAPDEPRLTFLPFIIKAVVQGLKDHPAVNASLDERAGEIVYHGRYDIGVAVDTPAGLTVPVIKDADQKRLRVIASEIDRLAKAAREGSLKADELRGGTFTVTSPGPFGGLMATPIVFHPQSAILGVHRATDRPVVRNGQIVIRKMMNLSITFDHRILDGMTAAKFVLDVVNLLEHPAVIALEA